MTALGAVMLASCDGPGSSDALNSMLWRIGTKMLAGSPASVYILRRAKVFVCPMCA